LRPLSGKRKLPVHRHIEKRGGGGEEREKKRGKGRDCDRKTPASKREKHWRRPDYWKKGKFSVLNNEERKIDWEKEGKR